MLKYTNDFSNQETISIAEMVQEFSMLPLLRLLEKPIDHKIYAQALERFSHFTQILHFGTGGSSLGSQALYRAIPNAQKAFCFFDNIDPLVLKKTMQNIDFKNTGIIIASKSGNTAETLVQLATIVCALKNSNIELAGHIIIICQTDGNALHQFGLQHEITVVPHNPLIGGRFAVFAEVGILPGLLAGFDMSAFCKGAVDIWQDFKNLPNHHSVTKAALYLASTQFHPVIFPYVDRLKVYGAWFAQLWAESLGKFNDRGVSKGSNPIQALGAVDQHSQMQLYLDGPKDKFFTFLSTDDHVDLPVVDLNINHPAYLPLKQKGLKALYSAEFQATYHTLKNHQLPVRHLYLSTIDTYNLGQLMMATVLETLIVAKIWRVNPFDQPAVEEGKKLALEFLSSYKAQ